MKGSFRCKFLECVIYLNVYYMDYFVNYFKWYFFDFISCQLWIGSCEFISNQLWISNLLYLCFTYSLFQIKQLNRYRLPYTRFDRPLPFNSSNCPYKSCDNHKLNLFVFFCSKVGYCPLLEYCTCVCNCAVNASTALQSLKTVYN